jgi:hypothetical protein
MDFYFSKTFYVHSLNTLGTVYSKLAWDILVVFENFLMHYFYQKPDSFSSKG